MRTRSGFRVAAFADGTPIRARTCSATSFAIWAGSHSAPGTTWVIGAASLPGTHRRLGMRWARGIRLDATAHKGRSVRGWADGGWAWCGRSGPGRTPAAEHEGRGLAAELAVERRGGVGAGRYRVPLTRAAGQ